MVIKDHINIPTCHTKGLIASILIRRYLGYTSIDNSKYLSVHSSFKSLLFCFRKETLLKILWNTKFEIRKLISVIPNLF